MAIMGFRYKKILLFGIIFILIGVFVLKSQRSVPVIPPFETLKHWNIETSARKAFGEGMEAYSGGRLNGAILKFSKALTLQPEYSAAAIKLADAKNKLAKVADEGYLRGLDNFKSLHFARAISEWENVLAMLGDKDGERYKKIEGQINAAKLKLGRKNYEVGETEISTEGN